MKVIFFGNRGSRPIGASQDSSYAKYGGDTTAVGVICGDHHIALDTGTGFYKWQSALSNQMKRKGPYDFSIFYSHYHDDHTVGLPQSPLLFGEGNKIDFYGPDGEYSGQGKSLNSVFGHLANEPRNPNLQSVYGADFTNTQLSIECRSHFTVGDDVAITTLPVDHGSIKTLGYRVRYKGKSIVMISDMHHRLGQSGKHALDGRIIDFAKGADILVTDSHFTDSEYMTNPKMCQAFGHSTAEHGVRLAHCANVPIFVTHHHNPNKSDDELDLEMLKIRDYAENLGVNVFAAKPDLCANMDMTLNELLKSLEEQDAKPSERVKAIARPLAI